LRVGAQQTSSRLGRTAINESLEVGKSHSDPSRAKLDDRQLAALVQASQRVWANARKMAGLGEAHYLVDERGIGRELAVRCCGHLSGS